MSAGYSTRGKLYKALHPDIHGDVVDVPQPTERRGTWPSRMGIDAYTLFGYKRYRDDEDIPEVTYLPNAHGLGTPMEAARARAMRLERLWQRVFRYGGAVIVILVAFGGYGYVARRDEAISSGVSYYVKAQSLRVGQRACELDTHEGCLVCMHRETNGITVVSHHC